MSETKTILILSANPKDTARLRLDEEVRQIERALSRSKCREQFIVKSKWSVRLEDLRQSLLDEKPYIVHFCGHGKEDGLMVEDEQGKALLVAPDALSDLFKLSKAHLDLECVILNACYSQTQAEMINEHINYVIGMSQSIPDNLSVEFATGFYDTIGAGKSIVEAFKFARNAVDLNNPPEDVILPTLENGPLIEALQQQRSVGAKRDLARSLARTSEQRTFKKGDQLIRSGESIDKISFILRGAVTVLVDGRKVATRRAGQHIGEMGIIDPTKERFLTAIAIEETEVAEVSKDVLISISSKFPEIWRNLARELGEQLYSSYAVSFPMKRYIAVIIPIIAILSLVVWWSGKEEVFDHFVDVTKYPFEKSSIEIREGDKVKVFVEKANSVVLDCNYEGNTSVIGDKVPGEWQQETAVDPTLNFCSIIGRIGSETVPYFAIGAYTEFVSTRSGPLYIGINDTVKESCVPDCFWDNRESVYVRVAIGRKWKLWYYILSMLGLRGVFARTGVTLPRLILRTSR